MMTDGSNVTSCYVGHILHKHPRSTTVHALLTLWRCCAVAGYEAMARGHFAPDSVQDLGNDDFEHRCTNVQAGQTCWCEEFVTKEVKAVVRRTGERELHDKQCQSPRISRSCHCRQSTATPRSPHGVCMCVCFSVDPLPWKEHCKQYERGVKKSASQEAKRYVTALQLAFLLWEQWPMDTLAPDVNNEEDKAAYKEFVAWLMTEQYSWEVLRMCQFTYTASSIANASSMFCAVVP